MENTYQSCSLDHLGLVAGMYDKLGIGECLDDLIPQDESARHISIGQVCKALIINGLGFTQRTLYMVSTFFEHYPAELLIGSGVEAGMLNDSVLGRALDQIQAFGTTELFAHLSPLICDRLGLEGECGHMDISSFSVEGVYNSEDNRGEIADKIIHVQRGYSRDHRPDLNQVVLNLIVENRAGIPLHMEALHGNSDDKSSFSQTIDNHIDNLALDFKLDYLMMDAAGYTEKSLNSLGDQQKWISRVPETIKLCKDLVNSGVGEWQELMPGYKYQAVEANYAGIAQRWILVFSQPAYERQITTLKANYAKKSEAECKQLDKLMRQAFGCRQDALAAWEAFVKKCKYLQPELVHIYEKAYYNSAGRPAKGANPDFIQWYIEAQAVCQLADYKHLADTKGRFVLATNDMDQEHLPNEQILTYYKNQSKVERGFRFLKDPQFVASSFFVKKPERLEALLFILVLSLTIYAAIEYETRQALLHNGEYVPNQLGKPVQNPTARWIFAIFTGVQVLYINQQAPLILNLKPLHNKILTLLGPYFLKYYQIE